MNKLATAPGRVLAMSVISAQRRLNIG